jgi:hypothetical protein
MNLQPSIHGALCGARRRKALPARGLPQVICWRRHGALHRTRRGQTLSRGGLGFLEGCLKSARGDTGHCIAHGGGKRCQEEGSPEVRSRRHGALHRLWRRQAVPAQGRPQGCSKRRHATLHRAWGRQAVPAGGLLQASCSSSWQRELQAMSAERPTIRKTM